VLSLRHAVVMGFRQVSCRRSVRRGESLLYSVGSAKAPSFSRLPLLRVKAFSCVLGLFKSVAKVVSGRRWGPWTSLESIKREGSRRGKGVCSGSVKGCIKPRGL